jgi:hypothetical protein
VAGYKGCEVTGNLTVITVHDNPVVTITANNTAICAGETVILSTGSVTVNSVVDGVYTYQWAMNGVEIPNAIMSSYSQALTTAGSYEFTMRMAINNGLGCASDWSLPVLVNVEALPKVSLTVNNNSYCTGGDALLTAAVLPVGTYTYDWYLDDVLVATNNSNTFLSAGLPPQATAYNYHVVVRSAIGCEGTSNKVSVTASAIPVVNITSDYTEICPGGIATMTANVVPLGNYNYTWYVNGAASGYQEQFTFTNMPAGSYSVYVKVSPPVGFAGCEVNSSTVAVNVHSNPVVTIEADETAICQSGTVLLTVDNIVFDVPPGNASNYTYQWSVNGNTIPGATQDSYTQTLEGGIYEFKLRLIQDDGLGCASDWSAPVVVTVKDFEMPAFFTNNCDDNVTGSYRLVRVPITTNIVIPTTFEVDFVDITHAALRHTDLVRHDSYVGHYIEAHLPLQAGDYELIITLDGCPYTTIARVLVDSHSLGGATLIEQRWNDVLCVNNNPANNGGFTFYAYQWYKNGVLIPGATKQNYTEPDGRLNGSYHVALSGYAILGANNTVPVSYVSCPFVPTAQFSMSVYPVPVGMNQPLTFDTTLSAEELRGATFEIYDMTGRLVRTITNLSPQMSITGFGSIGMYIGRVITRNNGTMNIQFVVQ